MLPSATVIVLNGSVGQHVGAADVSGRGPGVEVALEPIPPSAMWIIENALQSEHRVRANAGAASGASATVQGTSTKPANLTDGAPVVEAESDLLTALSAELDSLKRMNPFQVLGVGYESGDIEIRSSFADLTKRYHPDRFARYQSEQLRRLAAEIFILIRDAYRKLGDASGRSAAQSAAGYSSSPRLLPAPRAQTSPVPPPPRSTRPPTSDGMQPAPVVAKPITPSVPATTSSVPTMPNASMPISIASVPKVASPVAASSESTGDQLIEAARFADARAVYKQQLKANPLDRVAQAGVEFCEGMLEAAQRFEAVLEIDPSNERAARQLAEMRRMATNERKGLLTKLMNKKD
jgi:DnaJ domain